MGGGNANTNIGDYKQTRRAEAAQTKQTLDKNNAEILISQYDTGDTLYRDPLYQDEVDQDYGDYETEEYFTEPETYQRKSSLTSWITTGMVMFFIFLIVPLILLFMWLASRFKFIWFDSIIKNDASVVEPFGRYKKEGNSLFVFYLVVFLVTLAFFGFLALWVFGVGKASGLFSSGSMWSFSKAIGAFLIPGLLAVAGFIFLIFLHLAIDQFVVTIMAMDNSLFKPAWDKFMNIYNNNCKEFWFYVLVLIGLGILCAILAVIVALACLLVLALAAAILFGIPYLLLGMLLKIMPLFIAYAVIVGIPFIAVAILLLMCVNLPFAVFFRSFSLYFLSSLDCEYDPLEI